MTEITHVGREEALDAVRRKVADVEVVLDIGAGIVPQPFVRKPLVHICVDAHRPYLDHVKREVEDDPRFVLVNAGWDEALAMLPDKSVDSVFALDVIEHLEKEEGLRMLAEAERVARVQIVVSTPHGFFPQSYEPGGRDRWGMHGGHWQTHRSGWTPEDFGAGWTFVISPDYITVDEHNEVMDEPMAALWALRDIEAAGPRRYRLVEGAVVPHLATERWSQFKTKLQDRLSPTAYQRLRGTWRAFRGP